MYWCDNGCRTDRTTSRLVDSVSWTAGVARLVGAKSLALICRGRPLRPDRPPFVPLFGRVEVVPAGHSEPVSIRVSELDPRVPSYLRVSLSEHRSCQVTGGHP